jgi:hypothetical protein
MRQSESRRFGRGAPLCFAFAAGLAAALSLAACDALKPLDFRDALFRHSGQPVPGSNEPFPNLASVPSAAPTSTSKDTREQIAQKMSAETKNGPTSDTNSGNVALPPPPTPLPANFVSTTAPMQLAGGDEPESDGQAPPASAAAPSPQPKRLQLPVQPTQPPRHAVHRALQPRAGSVLAIVLFDEDSAEIDPDEAEKLKPLVDTVERQGGKLRLVG